MKITSKLPLHSITTAFYKFELKKHISFLAFVLLALNSFSQPVISSFSPASGPVGTSVTISGSGFSSTPSANIVFFGAVKATVSSASASSLTVQVPVGTTYQPITVTTNNLTGYSAKPFVVTFPGGNDLTGNYNFSFDAPIDSTTDLHPNDVAMADFDGDGKVDIATSNNYSITGLPASVSILRNTGSIRNISFAPKLDIPTGIFTYGIAAADLNGDGKPDLISSSIADQKISIYKNTSTAGNISFATKIDYPSQESPYRIVVNDIDGDGKPDIVVANNIFSSTVSVFRNTSSNGNISFAAKLDFLSNISPYSVTINDFDGDGKADVAVCNDFANTVSVLRNTSAVGTISFAQAKDFATGSTPHGITSGDIDGDGKADIATANYGASSFSALRNVSTVGNIAFAAKIDFSVGYTPFSISMGDLNGDGKLDIVVPSTNLAAAQNTSTIGNIAFANKIFFFPGLAPNLVGIGDLDGDGKNDLAASLFTSEKIKFYRNKNNEPTIQNFTPTTAVSGTAVTITGANFTNTTAVSFGGVPASSFTIVSSSTITAVVGSGTSGDVSISNAYGTHKKSGFSFVGPPVITSFTPATGNQESIITITGDNFTGTTSVSFGGVTATSFTVVSPRTITAIAANGISGNISVTNPYGTASIPGFTFVPPPTISSFTPSNGQAGTTVTIDGTNFSGATQVNFGGAPAQSFSILSSTSISAIVADGASGNIEVVTFGGKAKSSTMFTFPASMITSFTPLSGNAGTTVIINGSNFRSSPSDNIIYFGAAKATVTSATNNRLTVIVPEGATHQPITVTTNNYTSYSSEPFTLTYPDGNAGINSSSFTWKAAFKSDEDPRRILLSDLDADGKTDLIIQNYFSGSISFLRNTSTDQSISFAPYQNIASGFGTNTTANIAVGDIDSDGKPDLVVSNVGLSVWVFKNTSQAGSISFASKVNLPADSSNSSVALGDFDSDGKIDIAVRTANFVASSFEISLYKNTTSNGVISFAPKQRVATGFSGELMATDIDKDGKMDLLASTTDGSPSFIVWRNTSSVGNISFSTYQRFPGGNGPFYQHQTFGDLNGDGTPELIHSNYYDSTFSVLKNISSSGAISFDSKIDFDVEGAATYISTGQLDGDGKLDVIVVNEKKISVFRNTSNNSAISFAPRQDYSTQVTYNWIYGIGVGDIDGDGKPDICAANGADNRVSIFKNREGKKIVNICSASASLVSSLNGNSYQWQVNSGNGFTNLSNNSFYTGANNSTLQLTNIPLSYNNYEYRCLVDGNPSTIVVINVTQSLTPSIAIIASANNICAGTPATFTATPINGGTTPSYQWQVNNINVGTNTNIFTSTTLNNNDQVKVILTSNASCVTTPTATSTAITMSVNASTKLSGKASSPAQVCAGTSYNVNFSGTNTPNGSSVQLWESTNNSAFNAQTTQTYNGTTLNFPITSTNSGSKKYFFKITPSANNTCAVANNSDTSTTVIDQLAKPVISVTAKTITITNPDAGATYLWQIQDTGSNWINVNPATTGLSYTAAMTGTYRARSDKGQCTQFSEAHLVSLTNPNTNPSNETVLLYPNPTQGILTLDSLKLSDNWEVLDIVSLQSGQTVASFNIINKTKITVHLEALSNGIYLAVLRRRDGSSISIEFVKM